MSMNPLVKLTDMREGFQLARAAVKALQRLVEIAEVEHKAKEDERRCPYGCGNHVA